MDRRTRNLAIVGAGVLFVVGVLFGFILGSSGGEEQAAPSTTHPGATTTVSPSTVVVTPSPGEAPAISTEGRVLQDGRTVIAAPSNAACAALVAAGTIGDCGEVTVAGQEVVWVIEHSTTPTGTTAFSVGINTYVPEEGGWVRWLEASDPTGARWADVNVLASDLTSDGVSELLVGFRSPGEADVLEYDIVGYDENAVPEVLAHPESAPKGSVVVSAGTILEYSAQYPNGEPVCCPSSYLRRSIGFADSFFRVTGSQTVVTTAVPTSQL